MRKSTFIILIITHFLNAGGWEYPLQSEMKKSCVKGNMRACYNIADIYNGVEEKNSSYFYKKSCKGSYIRACNKLIELNLINNTRDSKLIQKNKFLEIFTPEVKEKFKIYLPIYNIISYNDKLGLHYIVLTEDQNKTSVLQDEIKAFHFILKNGELELINTIRDFGKFWFSKYLQLKDIDNDKEIDPLLVYGNSTSLKIIIFYKGKKQVLVSYLNRNEDMYSTLKINKSLYRLPEVIQKRVKKIVKNIDDKNYISFPINWEESINKKESYILTYNFISGKSLLQKKIRKQNIYNKLKKEFNIKYQIQDIFKYEDSKGLNYLITTKNQFNETKISFYTKSINNVEFKTLIPFNNFWSKYLHLDDLDEDNEIDPILIYGNSEYAKVVIYYKSKIHYLYVTSGSSNYFEVLNKDFFKLPKIVQKKGIDILVKALREGLFKYYGKDIDALSLNNNYYHKVINNNSLIND